MSFTKDFSSLNHRITHELRTLEAAAIAANKKYHVTRDALSTERKKLHAQFTDKIIAFIIDKGTPQPDANTIASFTLKDSPTFTRTNGTTYTLIDVRVYKSGKDLRLSWVNSDTGYSVFKDEEPLYDCKAFESWACQTFIFSPLTTNDRDIQETTVTHLKSVTL